MIITNIASENLDIIAVRTVDTFNDYAVNYSTKSLERAMSVIGIIDGIIVELATARLYVGKRSNGYKVFASVWFDRFEHECDGISAFSGYTVSGSGRACGYGYDLDSSALYQAMRSSGFEFFTAPQLRDTSNNAAADVKHHNFSGRGMEVAETALMACCVSLGYTGSMRLIAHV